MNLKEQFIKADIEVLETRREKLLNRKREIEVTLQGVELRIKKKKGQYETINNSKSYLQDFKIYIIRTYKGIFFNLLDIGFFNGKKS